MTETTQLPPNPQPSLRALRRSPTDRVVAGVAGGLGEYFGVDPILFRVLFAVTALFGGAGLLAYLLAWLLMPEREASSAGLDRAVAALRRHRVPLWLALAVLVALTWAIAGTWWAPGGFVPAVIAIVLLVVVLSRRSAPAMWVPPTEPATPFPTTSFPTEVPTAPFPTGDPAWLAETRAWAAEDRARRRRSAPVLATTLAVLVLTMAGLALADWVGGIVLPVYLWTALGIVVAGLLIGSALRRIPWLLTLLIAPLTVGLVAFAGTPASLHDGVGQRTWAPATAADLPGSYRLAFGRSVVDLRNLAPLDDARTVDVVMAAGQADVRVPTNANVTIRAHVRFGEISVDGSETAGNSASRTITPPAGAVGAPLTLDVTLEEGQIAVHRG